MSDHPSPRQLAQRRGQAQRRAGQKRERRRQWQEQLAAALRDAALKAKADSVVAGLVNNHGSLVALIASVALTLSAYLKYAEEWRGKDAAAGMRAALREHGAAR